jgi:hypothetical protein
VHFTLVGEYCRRNTRLEMPHIAMYWKVASSILAQAITTHLEPELEQLFALIAVRQPPRTGADRSHSLGGAVCSFDEQQPLVESLLRRLDVVHLAARRGSAYDGTNRE